MINNQDKVSHIDELHDLMGKHDKNVKELEEVNQNYDQLKE